ncbi:hypothetical protein DdX_16981 [Ditylenchus destructor]|uniref:Uncharacterized protein n=1 Tax=Ditylenchus destructor TaxID=166010 RepID=A0AAD4MS94_9BILA|nr:hypothetical protein DdX_16981 [Ditylenchus destructor]
MDVNNLNSSDYRSFFVSCVTDHFSTKYPSDVITVLNKHNSLEQTKPKKEVHSRASANAAELLTIRFGSNCSVPLLTHNKTITKVTENIAPTRHVDSETAYKLLRGLNFATFPSNKWDKNEIVPYAFDSSIESDPSKKSQIKNPLTSGATTPVSTLKRRLRKTNLGTTRS